MLVLHWTRRRAAPGAGGAGDGPRSASADGADDDGDDARDTGGKLVRLHFLSQLLPEIFDFLHEHLTAGILGTKLFLFPFHRGVSVTAEGAAALLAQADFCRRAGGAALVTPESRGSMLDQKMEELRLRGDGAVSDMLQQLAERPWFDVCDESDEILRVRCLCFPVHGLSEYACVPPPPLCAAAAATLLLTEWTCVIAART